jgi:hypothetical protein
MSFTSTKSLVLFAGLLGLSGCFSAEVLSPEPSAIELDTDAPACPGIDALSVSSGPSLSVTWGQATDAVTQASKITYLIYLKTPSTSYDLVSPTKLVIGATSTLVTQGIAVGQSYTLFVACKDEAGNVYPTGPLNERSVTVLDSQAPNAITDLAAVSPSFTRILLTWSPSDDGLGGTGASQMRYKVYASTTSPVSTSGTPVATVTGTTSYLHMGLNPNTAWYYKVVAEDSENNLSAASNQATNTTLDDTTPPAFATDSGLTVGTRSSSEISLSWDTASDNVNAVSELRYALYRCSGSTSCDPFATSALITLPAGTTSYDDTGLSASTTYVYGVRALDYRNNASTNTDKLVTSTIFSSTGSFYGYSSLREVGARLGQSVVIGNFYGDLTGPNAYPDLVIGAPNASEAGSTFTNTGCIYIFEGLSDGVFSTAPVRTICQPNPSGNGGNARNFGYAMAAGDFNGDGYQDLVVTAPQQNKFFIYLRESGGLASSATAVNRTQGGTLFAPGVCTGDIDGTGADDIVVTSPVETCTGGCGRTNTGLVLVYGNTSSGGTFIAPSSPTVTLSPTEPIVSAGFPIANLANSEYIPFGCTIGNFDSGNPTQTQLVIGSGYVGSLLNNEGIVAFYRKTAANTLTFQNFLLGGVASTYWGWALAALQVDSGIQELFVGAPYDSSAGTTSGAVDAYRVTMSGSNFQLNDMGGAYYGGNDLNANGVGSGIAVGDVNGDGKQDMVVGASLDDRTYTAGASNLEIGNAYLYLNDGTSVSSNIVQQDYDTNDVDVRTHQLYGTCLAHGDVNNDGIEDLIVGSPGQDFDAVTQLNSANQGAVFVYYGQAAGEIDMQHPDQVLVPPGNQASAYFGNACDVMDYNGDGRADLLVGSPYRDIGTQADRGAVYVYYGAANSPLPSISSSVLYGPEVTNGYFGYSLTHGDWDGDGKDDLAVGAIDINSGQAASGRAYVFFADATTGAIRSSSPVTIDPPTVTSASMYFGFAMTAFKTKIGSAGTNLVICAPRYDTASDELASGVAATADIGNCWIYQGAISENGAASSYYINTTPTTAIRYPYSLTSVSAGWYFGTALTHGDWDNDGIEDLVICAANHRAYAGPSNGVSGAGACFAFRGKSGGGFQTYVSYNGTIPTADFVYYNPAAESGGATGFGYATLLTDINNNGRDDFLVGEPNADNIGGPSYLGWDTGRVFVIRGGF